MTNEEYTVLYYALPIIGLILSLAADLLVKSRYNIYKKEKITKPITGCDVARTILDNNGLSNIKILRNSGTLTDHYDPTKKVVNLSADIYDGATIAAASVAAHECGHAIQDKVGYTPMRIRAKIIPMVNFSTKIGYIAITIGLLFNALNLAIIGLILLLAMLLFQLVTLPVEFNASSRAKEQLDKLNILNQNEQSGAKKMLTAAAMTYVASVITTLLQILRIAISILSRRDNR